MTSGREIAATSGPVGYAIAQVAHVHRMELVSRLRALGLYPGQELIIVDLHENPNSNQGDLVGRLGVDQSTVAKALARMEKAGLVTRTRNDADARVVRTKLTLQGENVVSSVKTTWADLDRVAMSGLQQQEINHLLELLGKVRGAIERR
jgi:DNA-binding MarR family transcriptional regulator